MAVYMRLRYDTDDQYSGETRGDLSIIQMTTDGNPFQELSCEDRSALAGSPDLGLLTMIP